jgi:YbbR domain-containing protein
MSNLETRFFTVPLLIESSDTLTPVNSFASSVKISVRGEAEGIQPILAEDIEAYIDLGRYSNEGNYRVPVQIRKKGSVLGVEPLEISVLPIEIPLLLEQKVTHNINVFPVLSGKVAEGYELTNQSLFPSSVIVEGPRSIFDSHIEFNTETINLDRRYNDFSVMVNIKNDNPLFSIHGSNILEFHGFISRIAREEQENNTAYSAGTENTAEPSNGAFEGGGQ